MMAGASAQYVEESMRWLAVRDEFARAVHAAPSLDAVLDAACAQALARLNACHAVAFLATEVGPGASERDLASGYAPLRATEVRATDRSPLPALLTEHAGDGTLLVEVPDLREHSALAAYAARAAEEGISALVDLPLEAQGRCLGHWALFYREPHRCGTAELDALRACAGHLSTALANALRMDELVTRTQRLSITYEIGRELNSELRLGQALRGILEICIRNVKAETGSLVAFEASGKTLSAWRYEDGELSETPVDRIQLVIDQGLAGWVMRQREAAFVPDTSRDPRWLQKPGATPRSVLCLPLLHGDEVVGIMTLVHPQPNAFTRDDLDLLAAVADQAALAVQNARLFRAAEARAQQLATLNEVSRSISSTLDLDGVLDLIMGKALEFLDAEAGSLVLVEGPQRDLVFRVTRGAHAEQVAGRRLRWGTGLTGQVAAEGVPVISNDVRSDPRWFAQTDDAGFMRSMMVVPLMSHGRAIGVLTAINKCDAEGFTARDVEMIGAFADQAAIAVENARLFYSTDQALAARVDELSALEVITREIASSLDPQHVIDVLISRAQAVTRAPRALVALTAEGGDRVEVADAHGYDALPVQLLNRHNVVWRVVTGGQPLVLADVGQSTEDLDVGDARSLLCVPIVYERVVLGAIKLEADEPGALNAGHVKFLAQLADHAALGIQNARLFAEVTRVRDRLQTVLNSASDGIAMFDPAGRLLLVNPALCALAGRQLEPCSATTETGLTFDELHQRLGVGEYTLERVVAGLRGAGFVRHAFQIATPAKRFVEELVVPVAATAGAEVPGARVPLLAVWYDVTKQKELEQTRDEFTHMLVHDLRSPLGAVIGGLSLADEITETPEGLDVGMVRETVRIALDGAKHLLELINSILDINKLESGQMPLELKPAAPADLAADAVRTLAPAATAAGVALASEVPADLPLVQVDVEKVGRVLVNLISNALKFTPSGKHVTVRAGVADGTVTLMVADEGPGIPADYRTRIFEKFVQVPGSKGRQKGTGLGLTFCKLVVEAHGGRIRVECPETGGSVFAFSVPVQR